MVNNVRGRDMWGLGYDRSDRGGEAVGIFKWSEGRGKDIRGGDPGPGLIIALVLARVCGRVGGEHRGEVGR